MAIKNRIWLTALPDLSFRYPLLLDLCGQPTVVVGAGRVALRKIRGLLAAGANVTVVSPVAVPAIRRLARSKRLRWLRRRYLAGDTRAARLVVAATDDEVVNRRVCAEARRRRVLVNCVAPPAAGDFIVPAVVRRGLLTIAISTGGASPALAKQLRLELEELIGRRYARAAKQMQIIRQQTAGHVASARARQQLYRRGVRERLAAIPGQRR